MLKYAAQGAENVDFLNSGTVRSNSNDERTMSNLTRKEYLNGRYQQTRNSGVNKSPKNTENEDRILVKPTDHTSRLGPSNHTSRI